MRLQKYMAECGVASRRVSEQLIAEGRLQVNGEVASLGLKIDPEVDTVLFDGNLVGLDAKVYVVLNKPRGVITTATDTHDRKTVLDCLEGVEARVYPVGRLDMDVSGMLLLTNDGELANRLSHPRYEVDKVYSAWVKGLVMPDVVKQLEEGVELEDGLTAPAKVTIVKNQSNSTLIHLVIHEGKKHIVKRMCKTVGHPISSLRRVSMGNLSVSNLQPGEWRYLEADEVERLYGMVGLDV
jgi:23S rRNA pseudouridine2605 synthase